MRPLAANIDRLIDYAIAARDREERRAQAARVFYLFTEQRAEAIAAMPAVNHVNWLHPAVWANWPEPMPDGGVWPDDVPLANAREIGRLCATGGIAYATNDPAHERPIPFVRRARR
jgi:hypothetical protein